MKVVIIGASAAGCATAARLRRLSEGTQIALIEKNSYISYANCALPYYTGGVIKNKDDLFVVGKEYFKDHYRVQILTSTKAVAINRDEKYVAAKNHLLQSQKVYYDKLVIATGAAPVIPQFAQGIRGVFGLRRVEDAVQIKEYIQNQRIKSAVVVGGGFIGIEMAENLRNAGLEITLVEKLPQVMAGLDFEIAQYLHRKLNANGVRLRLGTGIGALARTAEGLKITLDDGSIIECAACIMAMGQSAQSSLAKECGLQVNEQGLIEVDDTLRTNDENIYAAGDVILVKGVPEDRMGAVPLASPATKQARILAYNLVNDKPKHYKGAIGTCIAKIFSLNAGSCGAGGKALQSRPDTACVTVHANQHVAYYPGAQPIHLRMYFDKKSGLVLGAQAAGGPGTDKAIETLSLAVQNHLTAEDLTFMESAYAPPFSSARCPVNMAGSSADNVVCGLVENLDYPQYLKFKAEHPEAVLLDVRTPEEFELKRIDGAVNVPWNRLRRAIDEGALDKSKPYVVHCQAGVRSYNACRILMQKGFKEVYNLSGGMISYLAFTYQAN